MKRRIASSKNVQILPDSARELDLEELKTVVGGADDTQPTRTEFVALRSKSRVQVLHPQSPLFGVRPGVLK